MKEHPMIGTTIGNYRILSLLGEGGMATVYLAEHTLLDTRHAFKMLHEEFLRKENINKRFLAEAKSMARMSSPYLVKVIDMVNLPTCLAFVMEYIEGKTLKEVLDQRALNDEQIYSCLSQMLEALAYVHGEQLIHRDIKPSNFMLNVQGKVKLMDFGIAKNTDASSAEYTQTGTGVTMGTPMYMSPEQITETKSVTIASDIYSLGVVLWQMVTGSKPYDTQTLNTFQLQMKIVQEPLPMTGTPWDAMIQSATQKDPAARFSSCEAFLEAINRMGRQKSTGNFSSVSTTLSSILGGLNTVSTILEGLKRPRRKQSNEKAATDSTTIIVDNQTELFGMVKSNEIPSLKIGEQVWMSKNLDVSHFRNGDPIPEARTAKEWTAARKEGKPAWSYYENRRLQDDPIHGQDYGKLYNWYAVNDPRGLAPEGWHVPSDDEWTVLTDTLGGVKAAGNKLKSISGWKYNCNGTNESGFNGLPGGRCIFGRFIHIGVRGVWWSSSPYQYSIDYACSHYLTNGSLESYDNHKGIGCSVRCIQD